MRAQGLSTIRAFFEASWTDCLLALLARLKATGAIGFLAETAAGRALVAQVHFATVAIIRILRADPGTALGALAAVPLRKMDVRGTLVVGG